MAEQQHKFISQDNDGSEVDYSEGHPGTDHQKLEDFKDSLVEGIGSNATIYEPPSFMPREHYPSNFDPHPASKDIPESESTHDFDSQSSSLPSTSTLASPGYSQSLSASARLPITVNSTTTASRPSNPPISTNTEIIPVADPIHISTHRPLTRPHCQGMSEHPDAESERSRLLLESLPSLHSTPLAIHLSHGLAYTVGSALGSTPPSVAQCLNAFSMTNKVGLMVGARAWSKHGHRSIGSHSTSPMASETIRNSSHIQVVQQHSLALGDDAEVAISPALVATFDDSKSTSCPNIAESPENSGLLHLADSDIIAVDSPSSRHRTMTAEARKSKSSKRSGDAGGYLGIPSGPVSTINAKALEIFWRVMNGATWRNLHWLPHEVLVYEVRVPEGYGMRWAQDQGALRRASRKDPQEKESEEGNFTTASTETGGNGPTEEEGVAVSGGRNVGENFTKVDAYESVSNEQPFETSQLPPWTFRGFVEPMMENGHEVGWRH